MNRTNIAAEVWWTQISSSRQLVSRVKEYMENEQSFVLHIPKQIPWKDKFYSRIEDTAGVSRRPLKARGSEERTKRTLSWKPEQSDLSAGRFLLNNEDLFTDAERCAYHLSKSYPDYIAELHSSLLAQSFIWVTNITTQRDIVDWVNFVVEYNKVADERAVFILEYCGPEYTPPAEVPLVRYCVEAMDYCVEAMDCRVFCLELASILANTTQKEYQAELGFRVGNLDPEISARLMSMGEVFIEDPVGAAMSLDHARYSDGTSYPAFDRSQIESAVWRANISMLFPVLEQWRLALIAKYETDLQKYLPVENSLGEKVEKPSELELGVLYFMTQSNKAVSHVFAEAECSALELCRKVRNMLAHNEAVAFDDVRCVLELKMPKMKGE